MRNFLHKRLTGRHAETSATDCKDEAATLCEEVEPGPASANLATSTDEQLQDIDLDPPETSAEDSGADPKAPPLKSPQLAAAIVFGLLPTIVVVLGGVVGFLKWDLSLARGSQSASAESVQAASEATVRMLSYQPDTVEQDLGAAQDRMTGGFRDDYAKLTHDVVIPGAKEKKIGAVATVAAASSVSATLDHAVVLVFVNQTVTMGSGPPTNTASSVRVTLDKSDSQWLMSAFDPV